MKPKGIQSSPQPHHVAIIMDGNGRWALGKKKPRSYGHEHGVLTAKEIITFSSSIGIKNLTLYTFSEENWQRPILEVHALMNLFLDSLVKFTPLLIENNIKLIFQGNIQKFPKKLALSFIKTAKDTDFASPTMVLNLAISYSGQQEIVDAVKKWAFENLLYNNTVDSNKQKKIISSLSIASFKNFLYQPDLPPPDLLIRTGGERRISNFLLWQLAYTEIYFSKTLWPDFSQDEFSHILKDFTTRDRRYGKIQMHQPNKTSTLSSSTTQPTFKESHLLYENNSF